MRRFTTICTVVAAAVMLLGQVQKSWAISASGGPGPSEVTLVPFGTTIPGAWAVGTEDNPVPVAFDPAAGPWVKNLVLPTAVPIQPGTIIDLFEFITNSGPIPWTDWHEQIITPGWDWANTAANHPSSPTDPNAQFTVSDDVINMLFATPVNPGQDLEIVKYLVFNGAPGTLTPIIQIQEWPTVGRPVPEPATMGLGLLGLLGLGVGVLRRQRGM